MQTPAATVKLVPKVLYFTLVPYNNVFSLVVATDAIVTVNDGSVGMFELACVDPNARSAWPSTRPVWVELDAQNKFALAIQAKMTVKLQALITYWSGNITPWEPWIASVAALNIVADSEIALLRG